MTGRTVGSEIASVSVVAQDAAMAEVAATAALVAGPVDGLGLLEHLGLHGLVVDRSGELRHTSRLAVAA